MSLSFTTTPYVFQPVLSDGIYFSVSSTTFDATTQFNFKYNYNLYVEDVLVFEGKCSPNPSGVGIIDLQQVLETYTNSIPLSYYETTPIYTYETFPFSRPVNDEVINFYIKVGYEYSSTAIAPITGFTGIGDSVGPPAFPSDVYKTFRSTMGTNGRATQQYFDINPYLMSGTPTTFNPTQTGLFLTNAPRYIDLQTEDYFTLAFTNYYLQNTTGSTLSEGYYVKYTFYNDQGAVISATTYENIYSNGGGPRTNCNQVYPELYLIDPYSGTTDYNTLYVAAGPANLPEIPANTVQYTVQLWGHFTGTTTPIQPTPTPTPSPTSTPITPTPTPSVSPTPYCAGCTEYQLVYTGENESTSITITNCQTGASQNLVLEPNLYYLICSCTVPLIGPDTDIQTGGSCVAITPTPTPSSCSCREYVLENISDTGSFAQYIDCYGDGQTIGLDGFESLTVCACSVPSGLYIRVQLIGSCAPVSPTPTPTLTTTPTQTIGLTPTPTHTPTPSSTAGCYLTWVINLCSETCSGGICTCTNAGTQTVYTDCSVTDITDPSTAIYENTNLTNPFTGDFTKDGSIWNSTGANVTLVCVIGGPC